MNNDIVKVPENFKLIGNLCTGFSITILLLHTVACVFALITSALCLTPNSTSLFDLLYYIYFRDASCESEALIFEFDFTTTHTVFVLLIISLSVSFLCFCASVAVLIIINQEQWQRVKIAMYIFCGMYVAVLVVDITFATHFAIDYSYLVNHDLSSGSSAIAVSALRSGIMWLTILSLKGIFAHVVIMTLIAVVLKLCNDISHAGPHSIHQFKTTLNAFETRPPRLDYDPYSFESTRSRSIKSHVNGSFVSEEPLTPKALQPSNGFVNDLPPSRPNFARPQPIENIGSRPFTYLSEDVRSSPKPSPRPTMEPFFPPVPEPDYDDTPRMKSALKRTFM